VIQKEIQQKFIKPRQMKYMIWLMATESPFFTHLLMSLKVFKLLETACD